MGANPLQEWLTSCFLDYQLEYIYDDSPVVVVNKGRQLGISDASAGKITRRGRFKRRPQIYISASQGLATELLDTVRNHCALLEALGDRDANRFTTNNERKLEWATGGSVLALSSSARTGRSFHGDLYFDEFAFHEKPDKIWAAAAPMATREGWTINVVSTPNGAQGLFYDWCEANPPKGWSQHRFDLHRALRDGAALDVEKLHALVGYDERMFAEAYLCAFLDGNLQYIPTAMVTRASAWTGGVVTHETDGVEIHAGLDVGRHHDLTVLTIVALSGGLAWVVAQITCKRTEFAKQRAIVRQARRVFKWDTLHVDASGLGEDMAEEFVAAWSDDEVRALKFSNEVKADLATRTLRWFRDNLVRFPKNQTGVDLAADCVAIRRIVTPAGKIAYDAPVTARGHADRFWSLALALKGCGEPVAPRGYAQEPLLLVA